MSPFGASSSSQTKRELDWVKSLFHGFRGQNSIQVGNVRQAPQRRWCLSGALEAGEVFNW